MRMSLLVGVIVILAVAAGSARLPPLTDLERQRLLAHMQVTAAWLEDEVTGLSTAQATFRSAPNSWSILEVLDHLVVVGPIYWSELQGAKEASEWSARTVMDISGHC